LKDFVRSEEKKNNTSANYKYRLKESLPVKIAVRCISGSTKQKSQLPIFQDRYRRNGCLHIRVNDFQFRIAVIIPV